MPTIKRYNQPINIGGGTVAQTLNVRSSASNFGSSTASDLAKASQAVSNFASQLESQKNNRDALAISKTLIDEQSAFGQRQLALEHDAIPGAAGFSDNIKTEFGKLRDSLRSEFDDKGLSADNKARLELGLARFQSRVVGNAVVFEAKSQAAKVRSDVGDTLDTLKNQVSLNPASYTQSLEDASTILDAATLNGLSKTNAKNLGDQFINDATSNRFNALIDAATSPEEVVALRDDLKNFKKQLDPVQMNALLNQIDKAENKLEAARVYDFSVELDNQNQAVAAGKSGSGITESDIKAVVKDPIAQKKALRAFHQASLIGEQVAFVNSATNEEIAAQATKLQNAVNQGGKNFINNNAKLQTFAAAANRRAKEIADDVAAYTMKNNSSLQKSAQALTDNPSPEAMRNYVREQNVAQIGLGIAPSDRRLLTKPMEQMIASQLSSDSADGMTEDTTKTVDTIISTADFWGNNWPQVHRQLAADKVLTGVDLTLGSMTRPDQYNAAQTLAAANIHRKQLFELVPEKDRKDIHTETLSELRELQDTLPFNAQSSPAFLSRVDSVDLLATQYQANDNSLSATEAVAKAAEVIVLDSYEFVDSGTSSYRVPKSARQSVSEIETGAVHALATMDLSTVYALSLTDTPDSVTVEQMIDSVRDTGKWQTNGDESGLVLTDQNGNLVLRRVKGLNGRSDSLVPYEFTWEQLGHEYTNANVSFGDTVAGPGS